jgi:hypothetical protein
MAAQIVGPSAVLRVLGSGLGSRGMVMMSGAMVAVVEAVAFDGFRRVLQEVVEAELEALATAVVQEAAGQVRGPEESAGVVLEEWVGGAVVVVESLVAEESAGGVAAAEESACRTVVVVSAGVVVAAPGQLQSRHAPLFIPALADRFRRMEAEGQVVVQSTSLQEDPRKVQEECRTHMPAVHQPQLQEDARMLEDRRTHLLVDLRQVQEGFHGHLP